MTLPNLEGFFEDDEEEMLMQAHRRQQRTAEPAGLPDLDGDDDDAPEMPSLSDDTQDDADDAPMALPDLGEDTSPELPDEMPMLDDAPPPPDDAGYETTDYDDAGYADYDDTADTVDYGDSEDAEGGYDDEGITPDAEGAGYSEDVDFEDWDLEAIDPEEESTTEISGDDSEELDNLLDSISYEGYGSDDGADDADYDSEHDAYSEDGADNTAYDAEDDAYSEDDADTDYDDEAAGDHAAGLHSDDDGAGAASDGDGEAGLGFFGRMKKKLHDVRDKAKEEPGSSDDADDGAADDDGEDRDDTDFTDDREDFTEDDEDTEDEEDREDDEDSDDDGRGKKKGPLQAVYAPIAKGYRAFHKGVFGLIIKILNVFCAIPFIGKFFRPIKEATRLLEMLTHFLPVVLIVGLWLFTNMSYVTSSASGEFPDEGEVEIGSGSYDRDSNTLEAEAENTGGIMVNVESEYTVYSSQFSLNPVSWFIPREVTTCTGAWTAVEQSDITTIEAECADTDKGGFWYRVQVDEVS